MEGVSRLAVILTNASSIMRDPTLPPLVLGEKTQDKPTGLCNADGSSGWKCFGQNIGGTIAVPQVAKNPKYMDMVQRTVDAFCFGRSDLGKSQISTYFNCLFNYFSRAASKQHSDPSANTPLFENVVLSEIGAFSAYAGQVSYADLCTPP